ncbi:MAG TPA: hypothetical protein VIF62_21395 [Labilithrix sp.]|jgi:hypothetical protein
MKSVLVALALALVGCSSSSSPAAPVDAGQPACASPVAGNYSLTRKIDAMQPNTCMLSDDKTASTVIIGTDGAITFQNTSGSCHGAVDGCTLTAKCSGTPTGGGTLELDIVWTFDGNGFHGSTTQTVAPTGMATCESTSVDTATRN